jgi:predicted TIM-barrel fold metal-dependent hydrolase
MNRTFLKIYLIIMIAFLASGACRYFFSGSEKDLQEKRASYSRPGLIDSHTHLSPYAIPAVSWIMDNVGIELFINFSGGSTIPEIRDSLIMSEKMNGRIKNMFNPDWDRIDEPDFGEEQAALFEKAVRAGFVGLKISKALGLFVKKADGNLIAVDDPMLDPLWKKAAELKVPVAIHIADPKAFWLPADRNNERFKELSVHPTWSYYGKNVPAFNELLSALEKVFRKHPATTFIAVHFGNNAEDPGYVLRLLETYPNVYIDIAARIPEFGRHDPEKLHDFFIRFQDRILFGTDLGVMPGSLMLGSSGNEEPVLEDAKKYYERHFEFFETDKKSIDHPTPIQGDWKVNGINLPYEVLDKLYRFNAEKLFLKL